MDIPAQTWQAFLGMFTEKETGYATPGELAKKLDHRTVQTPALDLVDRALVNLADGLTKRLIISIAPQEGKVSGFRGGFLCGCCCGTLI